MNKNLEHINYLKKILRQYEYEYYALGNPSVSDEEYDLRLRELINLEKQFPEYATDDSPTKRVGGFIADKFIKIKHQLPMLSLSNSFNDQELIKFDQDINKALKESNINQYSYVVEPKIDGLSISLIYQNNKLVQAISRGDGQIGEDLTNNIKTIKTVPLVIKNNEDRFEVRGEVFLSFAAFKKINDKITDEQKKFANPRNAASGSVRNLDSNLVAKRKLDMIVYYIPDEKNLANKQITKQSESLAYLKKQGFHVSNLNKTCLNINEVIQYIKEITAKKAQLPYPIDGLVIKLNEMNYHKNLGATSKFPKWATAYKFPATIVETKLKNINATVGRTGRITYVADLEPINLSGSMISAATLHNAEYIIANDIRINDIVKVFKAGEIIPKVIGPNLEQRSNNTTTFIPIEYCPVCNSLLEKNENEVDQYCTNADCPSRIINSLIHFCSKNAMDIEDLSEKNIEKFYQLGLIKKISDIYHLKNHKEAIFNANLKIKDKAFNNIISNIEKSKNNSLEKLLFAFGIRHVGEIMAKSLAKYFLNIKNLFHIDLETLKKINDVGPVVANSIVNFFNNENNLKMINELLSLGVNDQYLDQTAKSLANINSPYYKKTFCITGSFDIPRNQIKKLLEEKYNATVINQVTKETDYLIVGQDGGSKKDKAIKLNIKLIDQPIW